MVYALLSEYDEKYFSASSMLSAKILSLCGVAAFCTIFRIVRVLIGDSDYFCLLSAAECFAEKIIVHPFSQCAGFPDNCDKRTKPPEDPSIGGFLMNTYHVDTRDKTDKRIKWEVTPDEVQPA